MDKWGLKAHPSKSKFFCDKVTFLGHDISEWGMTPSESKVKAIRALPVPSDVPSLRRLLGFVSFYRGYLPGFSAKAAVLNELLLKKDVKWSWTAERDAAWQQIRDELCAPGNALRHARPELEFHLHTDWSQKGLSAVLTQTDPETGNEYLVACNSRSCNSHEAKYGSYRGEMLAAVWGVRSYRHYLLGAAKQTIIYTDHKGLTWLLSSLSHEGQYARWACAIQEYDLKVEYKPGSTHILADVPSRFPCETTADTTGAREPFPLRTAQDRREAALIELAPTDSKAAMSLMALCLAKDGVHTKFGVKSRSQPTQYDPASDQLLTPALFDKITQLVANAGFAEYHVPDPFEGYEVPGVEYDEDEDATGLNDNQIRLRSRASSQAEITFGNTMAQGWQHNLRRQPSGTLSVSPARGGRIMSIDASPAPIRCITGLIDDGVSVLELFGGLSAGVEALLRMGITVRKYIYCDISLSARAISRFRLHGLSLKYPEQFPQSAWDRAFNTLPPDVYAIAAHPELLVSQAGCLDDTQWFLVAGFECADLSPAGSRQGLEGMKSQTFFPLLQIIGELQRVLGANNKPPLLYLVENTAMQEQQGFSSLAVQAAYRTICHALGDPVVLDAARMDSGAHRLRNYWGNLSHPHILQRIVDTYHRTPGLHLTELLDPGRTPQRSLHTRRHPYYPTNQVGHLLEAFPTLMARVDSYAFRDNGPGMVWDTRYRRLQPLTMEERERILGYDTGCTNAPGVTNDDRHRALGGSFDANAVSNLLAAAVASRLYYLADEHLDSPAPIALTSAISIDRAEPPASTASAYVANDADQLIRILTDDLETQGEDFAQLASMAALADSQEHELYTPEQGGSVTGPTQLDVWKDPEVIKYLKSGGISNPENTRRIMTRASRYQWVNGKLLRKMHDQTTRIVPPPKARVPVIQSIHEQLGHYGRRRTTYMVMLSHWWVGLYQDVRDVVKACQGCDRTKASFNSVQPVLHPLPIMGMFYRWGCDLAGPFAKTERGNTYVLVCVEHFSKWIEAFPLRDKRSAEVAYHFLHGVIARFGSCAECVTDRGGEFEGEFGDLLQSALIDHRITSSAHPQANGLSERAVKTLKQCLDSYVTGSMSPKTRAYREANWDLYLPWILLGYRVSPQESTKLTPYQLMYAVPPTIPPALKERFTEPINFDDIGLAAESIRIRAYWLTKDNMTAGTNLNIAQHRDILRYEVTKDGFVRAPTAHFFVGKYVYMRDLGDALKSTARGEILRVLKVCESGVLVLVGSDATTVSVNAIHCAPCHLPIDDEIPILLDEDLASVAQCAWCRRGMDAEVLVLCDVCQRGWHTYCVGIKSVPKGLWACPQCIRAGVDPVKLQTLPMELSKIRQDRKERALNTGRHGRMKGGKTGLAVTNAVRPLVPVPTPVTRVRYGEPAPAAIYGAPSNQHGAMTVAKMRKLTSLATVLYGEPATTLLPFRFNWEGGARTQVPAMQCIMPGPWDSLLIWELQKALETGYSRLPASKAEARSLYQAIDFSQSPSILVMTHPQGEGIRTLQDEAPDVSFSTNHMAGSLYMDRHLDPLQPSSYRELSVVHGLHVIVLTPQSAMLADIAIPIATHFARQVVCCLVPGSFLLGAHSARAAWLRRVQSEARLHVIQHSQWAPVTPATSVWVLIFSDWSTRDRMVRAGFDQSISWSFPVPREAVQRII